MKKTLSFSSESSSLEIVERFVNNICEFEEVDERFYGNILLALTEAVNNAIEHGNSGNREKLVFLDYSKEKEILQFVIKDEGPGFDFKNVPDPTLPENIEKLTGRGIYLIKQLSDGVEYSENGSVLSIRFLVGQEVLVD